MPTCLQAEAFSEGLCITFTFSISFFKKTFYNKYVEDNFTTCLSVKFLNKFFLPSRVEKIYS